MLDPAAARNTFADDLVAEYQRLELILLELIADKISRGLDAPDWASRQVMELQRFRKEAGIIAAKMAGKSPELIASAIQRAVTDGFLAASQDIAIAEGLSAGQVVANAGTVPAIDGPAIAALLAETTGALTAVDRGVLRATDDIYRKVVARGAATVVAGAETRKLATQRALNEFTRNGITGFLDRRGKSWSLTAYTEMAIRTGTTKALMQSHSDRLTERGYDLVIVSSHPRPAPQCQPYERQILSLSGRTLGVISETSRTTGRTVSVKVKASLAEAESRGLHHPNCRHRHSLLVPGVTDTSPTKADDEGYEDTQKLRYMERQTREWKRRAATALDPADKKAANAKVREWQGKIKTHTEQSGVGRRRDREQLNLGNKIPTLDTAKVPTPKKPIPKADTTAADTKAWLDAEKIYTGDVKKWLAAEKKFNASRTLSQSTRDLIANAKAALPVDKAGWLETTATYPLDRNGAKLVPEKLQRHLDTTLAVGKAIRADAVKKFDTDSALKKLRKEDKDLLASGGAFSPRRDAIFRDIARREQAILLQTLSEVRPIGGVKQAVKLSTTGLGRATAGTAEGIASVRRAESIYPADWIRAGTARGELDIGKANRAFFNETWDFIAAYDKDYKPDYRGAFDSYPDEVMAHELGHRMETLIPGLTQLEFALIRSRSTKNGVLEPQTKLFPNKPELADEVGYEDDWRDRYAGKTYANDQMADPARRAAEAFQVGIQDTFGRSSFSGEFDKTSQLQGFVLGVMALL